MRVLLVSTYELGHQPLHVAAPAAALEAAGHRVWTLDVSVEAWEPSVLDGVDAVAFSVPMHTAMRLSRKGAEAVKRRRPDMPVCLYGLYAVVSREDSLARLADRVIAGEYTQELVAWADGLDASREVDLRRQRAHLPVRSSLPPLERYAHLAMDGEERPVGYVEATHGCAYRCRHCPVPVVYDGRTRKVPVEVVLADVAQLVEAGARHITFGDPDFLNRFRHATEVVEAVHTRFPDLTYDVTTKVEHVLRHRDLLGVLRDTGCLFCVSAFEILDDRILELLDKGHTASDAAVAVDLLREHAIEPRPSWLPFTPWTTVSDLRDICDFVVRHDLVGNVDPVQYSIRLLIPEGSLVLDIPQVAPYLGPYDAEHLTYTWRAADQRTVPLQRRLARIAEDATATIAQTFGDVRDAVLEACGERTTDREPILAGSVEGRPRLTEPWFC